MPLLITIASDDSPSSVAPAIPTTSPSSLALGSSLTNLPSFSARSGCSTALLHPSSPSASLHSSSSSSSSLSLLLPVSSSAPPSRYWTPDQAGWQLLSSLSTLRLTTLIQLTYNLTILTLSIWALCLVGGDVHQHLPPATSMSARQVHACFVAYLAFVLLSAPLCVTFALARWCRPRVVERRRWRVGYGVLRVWTGVALVVPTVALCALSGMDSPSEGVATGLTLVWVVTAVEWVTTAVPLLWYGLLHVVIPHSALSIMPPFLHAPPSSSSPLSPLVRAQHRRTVQAQLRALPPLLYTDALHCERQCVICVSDMVEGDRVRVFRCGHAYHAVCIDQWLVRRSVCPLCLQVVQLELGKSRDAPGHELLEQPALNRAEATTAMEMSAVED